MKHGFGKHAQEIFVLCSIDFTLYSDSGVC